MNKIFFFVFLIHSGLFLSAAENPVLEMFPGNITFYLSYDTGSIEADLAVGNWKAVREIRPAVFTPGVFGGQALKQGYHYYMAAGNFHPNQSGSLVVWVSPQNWPEKAPGLMEKEPGFSVFGAGLGMGKQYNQRGGKSCVHFTVQYSKYSKGVHISSEGNVCQWKNRSWHLMVAVWDLTTIALSVDGQPLKVTQVPEKALNHSMFSIGARNNDGYDVAIDEFTILDRKLTNEEISSLYQAAQTKIMK